MEKKKRGKRREEGGDAAVVNKELMAFHWQNPC